MPTRKSLEAEIYKRFHSADTKKLKQTIKGDTITETTLQIGDVIPFETIR